VESTQLKIKDIVVHVGLSALLQPSNLPTGKSPKNSLAFLSNSSSPVLSKTMAAKVGGKTTLSFTSETMVRSLKLTTLTNLEQPKLAEIACTIETRYRSKLQAIAWSWQRVSLLSSKPSTKVSSL